MSPCIYIGIDFGTTFSGVAWALSSRPNDIKIVTKWRTKRAFIADNAKTPTEIVYSDYKKRTVHSWGYEVDPQQEPLKWFKLCLEKKTNLPSDVQRSQQLAMAEEALRSKGLTAVDVASDYLRQLWESVVENLERQCGTAVNGLPFRVILTVPAMWSDGAKMNTRRAAEQAGILKQRRCGATVLDLVSEPEAAALATLAEFDDRPGVGTGDVVTVCDCGGGTVDIVSYKIQDINPVKVKECVEGEGKMCGALFVDQEFQDLLKGRLKRWDKLKPEQVTRIMETDWEYGIKRSFTGEGTFQVEIPPEATGGLLSRNKSARLQLTKGNIEGIFNPVMGRIRQLIRNQVGRVQKKETKRPKYIMLVGGFGACTYLYQVVKGEFESQGIEVLQPSGNATYGPWTAICRGAVIRAMTGLGSGMVEVTTRVAKRNYGINSMQKFVENHHLLVDRVWCVAEDGYYAKDQMQWCLRKGTDIASQEAVVLKYYHLIQSPSELEGGQLMCDIWISDADSPENRMTREVTKLCDIKVQIDTPFDQLPFHFNKAGSTYRRVAFDIEMTCAGAELKFSAIINGSRQAAQLVEALFP